MAKRLVAVLVVALGASATPADAAQSVVSIPSVNLPPEACDVTSVNVSRTSPSADRGITCPSIRNN